MTASEFDCVGVVLAGGYSTRFGPTEKALVPLDGVPMLRRVVDTVEPITDAVIVNCRREQRASFTRVLSDGDADIVFAVDPIDGMGPLAGLATGLAVHNASETVLLTCDQPFVDDGVIETLQDHLGSASAVVVWSEDRLQPTPVILSTREARAAVAEALADGERALLALFDRLDYHEVDARLFEDQATESPFRDVDEPLDLRYP